jgi:hypothetical protein
MKKTSRVLDYLTAARFITADANTFTSQSGKAGPSA